MPIKKSMLLVAVIIVMAASTAGLRVHTLETTNTTYGPGDEIEISGLIVNNEDQPIADHEVEFAVAYSPIYNPERAPNGETIQYRGYEPLEMSPSEVKYVNHTWTVGQNAAPGSYKIYYRILNENEDLQVFNTHRINVTDSGQTVKAVSIGDLFFHQGDAIGYDLEGLRVSSNETADATFNISNVGTTDLTVNISMDMHYTYDAGMTAFTKYKEVSVQEGEEKEVVMEFMPPDTPTTYTPVFEARDQEGNLLGSTNGRLVVRGESGRILRANIGKLTYQSSETVTLTADLIGPADYSGPITNATLAYTIEDENGVITDGERSVDISGQINEVTIESDTPRSFANPNVTMVLSKDGEEFDRYTASYTGGEEPSSVGITDTLRYLALALIVIFMVGIYYLMRRISQ